MINRYKHYIRRHRKCRRSCLWHNCRGEVVFFRRDAESAENNYLYDEIGNLNSYEIAGVVENSYSVNSRNQYLAIHENFASLRETNPQYDADGNLTHFGEWSYAYDSANRLVSVASNNTTVAEMFYDAQGRRVKKIAADGIHRYFYDGQLLVYEHITRPNNTVSEIDYVWGKDISGTRDGACGIGGLLYLKRDGVIYIPFYDAYGNVLGYTDAQGNVVAEYVYDAFGKIVAKSGAMADSFAFRFSTKYYDDESALHYYTYRYYSPELMRWLTEDPIAEDGGLNLYGFCGNNPVSRYDKDGRAYFIKRRMDWLPWVPFVSEGAQRDIDNRELAHEQLVFEDSGSPSDVGYSKEGIIKNDEAWKTRKWIRVPGSYNDCVMRKAVSRVTPLPYSLLGNDRNGIPQYNCQNYADALRAKYSELIFDKKIRCECGLDKDRK